MENDLGSLKDEFPDKYLFAEDLAGKRVTLKISAMNSDSLVTAKGKKRAVIVSFEGKKKLLVLNKTNACLINAIFPLAPGASLKTWIGKRITIYPTQCKLAGDTVDCIRVWGSPDLPADRDVVVQQGLKKVAMKVYAVTTAEPTTVKPKEETKPFDHQAAAAAAGVPVGATYSTVDPAVSDAWIALGWSQEQGLKHMDVFVASTPSANYLDHLGVMIDHENEKEETV